VSRRADFLQRQMAGLVGKAVHGYRMIAHGEKVAVGLSGGKDSLSLLWLLAERRRRVPIDFGIVALHVEMGFGAVDHAALERFCGGLGVELIIRHTDFGPRAHTAENREKSPCFFCALHRRRELFEMAAAAGCAKLALAHHQDDILETFLMNALFAGSLATMLPVQPFFGGEITVIRPLALVDASLTRRFAGKQGLPVQPPCCPSAEAGERARVREFLDGLHRSNKKVRPSLWAAITSAGLPGLPPEPDLTPYPAPESDS
jgi:tRNA 2-thiocytidine biosynthesis protein TtcA